MTWVINNSNNNNNNKIIIIIIIIITHVRSSCSEKECGLILRRYDHPIKRRCSHLHLRVIFTPATLCRKALNNSNAILLYFRDTSSRLSRDQLHWLPVKERVEFRQALFVYKVLRQTAPPYLVDVCQPVSTSSTRRHLRSAGHSRKSCGAAMQNNKIRKAKFSCVCSTNLELTTDDRSRRFYFNEQFQWTFGS